MIPALFLAACQHEAGTRDFGQQEQQERFGSAVRQNIKAQIVNPDAPSTDTLDHSGARASKAQERYQTDRVEKPERARTLESTESGGGEGGDE